MRLLAVIAALILTIICRPLAGSPPPRVPDGAEQPPSEDDWREAFASRASARHVADLRRESVGTALFRYATIARDDRLRHASHRPPVVPRVRRASFSIDDAAGAIRVPERPVYASPQTNTGGVISPDQPVTVTVPFGHGHVAMTNPAPVYYNAAQPGYASTWPVYAPVQPAYAAPMLPYYAAPRRGIFGGRLLRGGGGACFVNADGSVSCGR
jgi:hypothetical protein